VKARENLESTVLVVGGAGYIGSHASRALRRHGYSVIIYDNLSTGCRSLADGFELVHADIQDVSILNKVLGRVGAVMHFAAHAYVGESVENPRKYFKNNVEASLALLNATIDSEVQAFVFSSTCAIYGSPELMPISEDNVRAPINPYGASKLFFENALEAYGRAYGLRYGCLRYFNAAGADDSGEIGEMHDPETHLIPLALEAANNGRKLQVLGGDYPTADGTCVRDYIHVSDLTEAHVLTLEQLMEGRTSLTVNLGAGRGASVLDVIKAVERATSKAVQYEVVPRRPGDPPVLIADPTRAQLELNWRATRSLDDMVSSAWRWKQREMNALSHSGI